MKINGTEIIAADTVTGALPQRRVRGEVRASFTVACKEFFKKRGMSDLSVEGERWLKKRRNFHARLKQKGAAE